MKCIWLLIAMHFCEKVVVVLSVGVDFDHFDSIIDNCKYVHQIISSVQKKNYSFFLYNFEAFTCIKNC